MNQTAQSNFRDLLKLKSIEAKVNFEKKYPAAHQFLLERGLELGRIRQHSAKLISAGALTGTLLISPPTGVGQLPSPTQILKSIDELSKNDGPQNSIPQKEFIDSLKTMLPEILDRFREMKKKD